MNFQKFMKKLSVCVDDDDDENERFDVSLTHSLSVIFLILDWKMFMNRRQRRIYNNETILFEMFEIQISLLSLSLSLFSLCALDF